jgi:hypothetical protein
MKKSKTFEAQIGRVYLRAFFMKKGLWSRARWRDRIIIGREVEDGVDYIYRSDWWK